LVYGARAVAGGLKPVALKLGNPALRGADIPARLLHT
jgi:hypothetical protein